jgi:hypothetical protein
MEENDFIEWLAAKNPATPAEALHILADDEDANVHRNVAQNRNTPRNLLAVLAEDLDTGVCEAALRRF